MDSEDHSNLLPAFKEYVEKIDESRSLKFEEIFPELKLLIK
jgi:hypothetical protein